MAAGHEVILEFSKLAGEHTTSLWKIASGFVALEVLIIAQVLMRTRDPALRARVSFWLFLSTAANVLSMVFGYLANAGVLHALKLHASGSPWTASTVGEAFNLLQMIALTLGLLLFVLVFLCNSRTVAKNLLLASGAAAETKGQGKEGK